MSVKLIDSLSPTEPLAEIFSDASVLRAMLDFEIALARVEGRPGEPHRDWQAVPPPHGVPY